MRILVVEDEHKIAHAMKKGLEQETYAVDVAYTGLQGYDFAFGEDYDIIILDVMLPEKSGFEIARELRSNKIHTPILMLTARGQTSDKVTGLDAGADDYLAKPFAFEELLARVRALARRPHTRLDETLRVDDLTLDTNTHTVKRQDIIVRLSSKEYALLEYLMRHQNKTLTKEQILSHVWDYDSDILPNTIEVYIGYLRNKIEKPFRGSAQLIRTIRGFGYSIGKD